MSLVARICCCWVVLCIPTIAAEEVSTGAPMRTETRSLHDAESANHPSTMASGGPLGVNFPVGRVGWDMPTITNTQASSLEENYQMGPLGNLGEGYPDSYPFQGGPHGNTSWRRASSSLGRVAMFASSYLAGTSADALSSNGATAGDTATGTEGDPRLAMAIEYLAPTSPEVQGFLQEERKEQKAIRMGRIAAARNALNSLIGEKKMRIVFTALVLLLGYLILYARRSSPEIPTPQMEIKKAGIMNRLRPIRLAIGLHQRIKEARNKEYNDIEIIKRQGTAAFGLDIHIKTQKDNLAETSSKTRDMDEGDEETDEEITNATEDIYHSESDDGEGFY